MELIPLATWLSENCRKRIILAKELLEVFVVSFPNLKKPPKPQVEADTYSQYSSIEQVVDRAVSIVIISSNDRPHHVLALGYRRKSPGTQPLSFNNAVHMHGISCKVPNSVVSYLKRPCWEKLLKEIGDELFLELLVKTVLLLKLGDTYYVQITGTMIPTCLRLNSTAKPNSDSTTRLERGFILYSSRYGKRCGLSNNHILLSNSITSLARQVFALSKGTHPSTRERHIAKGMLKRYAACPVGNILNACCPMPKSSTNVMNLCSSHEEVGKWLNPTHA